MDYQHIFEYEIGVQKIKYTGSQGLGLCPLHDDRKPSFSFNSDTGLWNCFSGCGSGNLYQLAERLNMDNPHQYIESSTMDSKKHRTNGYEPNTTLKSEDKDVDEVEITRKYEELKKRYQKNKFGDEIMILGKDKYVGENNYGDLVFFSCLDLVTEIMNHDNGYFRNSILGGPERDN